MRMRRPTADPASNGLIAAVRLAAAIVLSALLTAGCTDGEKGPGGVVFHEPEAYPTLLSEWGLMAFLSILGPIRAHKLFTPTLTTWKATFSER